MKTKLIALLTGILVFLFSVNLLAYTPPPAPVDGFLLDQTHVLSDADAARLRGRLAEINASTKNEIAVLVLASLEGEDINDVKFAVFNAWGVGKKGLDNGVLLVWSKGDRKIGIETGKGVGGELTDLQSNDIIKQMKPEMRSQNYAGALTTGVNAISVSLESRHNEKAKTSPHDEGEVTIFVIAGVIIFLIILFWLIAKRRGNSWGGFGGDSSWSSGGSWGSGDGGGFGGGESGGGGSSDSY